MKRQFRKIFWHKICFRIIVTEPEKRLESDLMQIGSETIRFNPRFQFWLRSIKIEFLIKIIPTSDSFGLKIQFRPTSVQINPN